MDKLKEIRANTLKLKEDWEARTGEK